LSGRDGKIKIPVSAGICTPANEEIGITKILNKKDWGGVVSTGPSLQSRKPGPLGQSKIPDCGGQSQTGLPVKIVSCFGVLEYWSIGVLEKARTRIST
jgi:hypothetical protein